MSQVAMTQDGRVVASGTLPLGGADQRLVKIGRYHKEDAPNGVVIYPRSQGRGRVVVRGADRFALGPDAIWVVV